MQGLFRKRVFLCLLLFTIMSFFIQPVWAASNYFNTELESGGQIVISSGDVALSGTDDAYENIFDNYKKVAQAISGFCMITSVLFLFVHITKWGTSGENLKARQDAQKGVLFSGIAIALFGSVELVVSFFWSIFL